MESRGFPVRPRAISSLVKGKGFVLPGIFLVWVSSSIAMESHEIATIPWGASEEALGLIDRPEVERVGPTSFTADSQGNLYVCDFVNQCVKKFDASGQFVEVVASNVAANHVAVDGAGRIYARLDDGHIGMFVGGKKTGGIKLSSSLRLIEGYEQGLSLLSAGEGQEKAAWVAVNDPGHQLHTVGFVGPQTNSLRVASSSEEESFAGFPGYEGMLYRPRWENRNLGRLLRFSSDGAELPSEIGRASCRERV